MYHACDCRAFASVRDSMRTRNATTIERSVRVNRKAVPRRKGGAEEALFTFYFSQEVRASVGLLYEYGREIR